MQEDETPPQNNSSPQENNSLGLNFATPDISKNRKQLEIIQQIPLPTFKKHPQSILDLRPIDFLIVLKDESAKLFHQPSFTRHIQMILAAHPNIDETHEKEEILIQHLTNCHIPTPQTMKNAKLLNLQEQSRPRNTITKGLKTPERGIGSAVLLRARQGGELIKALTLLGPFIYKQQSYRILPANQLAKEFIVPAPTKKDNKALVSTVPYWVSDSLILTYLCNPNHIAHNTGITFWHTGPHSSGNLEHQLLRLEFKHSYLRTQFLELATSTDPFWTLEGPPGDNGLPSFHHLSFAKEEIEFPILMDFTPVRTPSQNPNAGLKKLKL
jgi:hypothetical protein